MSEVRVMSEHTKVIKLIKHWEFLKTHQILKELSDLDLVFCRDEPKFTELQR